MAEKYQWDYQSVGGVVRVNINKGEDLAHLGELDQKLWTVISCPSKGLEFDQKTLSLLDTDGDGKIRVPEVVAAAQWLCSVIRDKDLILKGGSVLPLDQIDTTVPEGEKLYKSAKQILANLGLEKNEIDIADSSDSVAIFAKTKFNGDGIITVDSVDSDEEKAAVQGCIDTVGSATDRSGAAGVNAELVEKFYAALADYAAWQAQAVSEKEAIFPFGDDTAAACGICDAMSDKIADYFMRCKLIRFDEECTAALDVSVDKIGSLRDLNLAGCSAQIAECPLARPTAEKVLPFDAINPAWQADFTALRTLVLDKVFEGKDSISEEEWAQVLAKFGAFKAWNAGKKGAEVEVLGLEKVNAIIAADRKQALLDAIAKDETLRADSEAIDAVDKLMHYWKYFYKFLMNYIVMKDFYSTDPDEKADFEVGELYIDQRCCKLCIKVEDMGKHADMAAQSGMFLLYCTCTSKVLGKSMDIVAALTDGKTGNLRAGTNAVFYDRNGQDWDAVVTKVVDNPISIRQAFWAPYAKLAKFVSDKVNKMAADKDSKVTADMQAGVANNNLATAAEASKKQPFDIAKFAGIFAAIGMALGMIGSAITGILHPWYSIFILLGVLIVCISGPSMFIAWTKLRKRNLGPVLNANGWAINASLLVNIIFGSTLTSVAKYPIIKVKDPYMKKGMPKWKKWFIASLVVIIAAGAALYFTDSLKCIGLPFHKEAAEVEAVECVEAAQDAAPAAEAAEAAENASTATE